MSFIAHCLECDQSFYRVSRQDFTCPNCGVVVTQLLRPGETCTGSRPVVADDAGKSGDGLKD